MKRRTIFQDDMDDFERAMDLIKLLPFMRYDMKPLTQNLLEFNLDPTGLEKSTFIAFCNNAQYVANAIFEEQYCYHSIGDGPVKFQGPGESIRAQYLRRKEYEGQAMEEYYSQQTKHIPVHPKFNDKEGT